MKFPSKDPQAPSASVIDQWYQSFQGAETVGEMVANDMRMAAVFNKYGIDFCCGGSKNLSQVCQEKGLNYFLVKRELQDAKENPLPPSLPYKEWPLDFLTSYITNVHHSYVRKAMPDILALSGKVAAVHGKKHPELLTIHQLFTEINEELTDHLNKEEMLLFPRICRLAEAARQQQFLPDVDISSMESPVFTMMWEHEKAGNLLASIRKVSNDFSIPEDACVSYGLLYKKLEAFESDLHLHVHLENNLLFPGIIRLVREGRG